MEKFKRLLSYVYPHRYVVGLSVIAALAESACESGKILLIQRVIDDALLKKDVRMLYLTAGALLALVFGQGVLSYVNAYFVSMVGNKIIMRLRNQLYAHIQGLSLDYFANTSTGMLMSKIMNDVGMLSGLVHISIEIIKEPLTAVSLFGAALYMDWKLTLMSCFVLPCIFLLIYRVGKVLRRYGRRGQQWVGEMTQLLQETLSGIRIVKAFGMEEREAKRFHRETDRLYKLAMKAVKLAGISSPAVEFLGAIAGAVILVYGGTRVVEGTTTQGQFFAFIAALFSMYKPVRRMNRLNAQIQSALAGSERVFEVLDTRATVQDRPGAVAFNEKIQSVRFEGVSFRYESEMVLKGIEFTVQPGEVIAFVGSSGAGKTTLVNLLPRFYDVTEGGIYLNDRDIRDLTIRSLRRQFAIVTQETFLFNDTVRNNILYGDPSRLQDDVVKAAEAANADEFIGKLPQAYDTIIGEKGVKLSGGQRQRIAIARALLKDAPLLILDEATSSLDTESEREVQQALEVLMRGRTTFVIAHRLSTVQSADRILVLSNGRVVETGPHRVLVERDGIYKHLYQLQFAG